MDNFLSGDVPPDHCPHRRTLVPNLQLTVRFLRHGTDDGIPCVEPSIHLQERKWSVPPEQSALVLVDCWAEHFIESHQADSGRIMLETLGPVVDSARKAGITIIHTPSPTYIQAYPQWVAYASDQDLGQGPAAPPPDDWPPPSFRRKEGEFAQYARVREPKVVDWVSDPSRYRIADAVAPQPGDFVVKTGDQLHRLLKHRRLLHLFYAGFATNMCILFRDYGTRAMHQRGYNVILLRDCTTGIEYSETVEGRWLTRAAIASIEVGVGHTTTSGSFLEACACL
jgi:nicotinamidase-related amidase